MRAKIKEEKNYLENRYMFKLYANDKLIECMCYNPEATEGDIWNRQYNLDRAMKKAKQIELMTSMEEETIIYESEY